MRVYIYIHTYIYIYIHIEREREREREALQPPASPGGAAPDAEEATVMTVSNSSSIVVWYSE